MQLKNPFTYIGTKNRKNSHPKCKFFEKKFSKKLRAAKKQLSRSGYSVIFSVIIGRWTIFPLPPAAEGRCRRKPCPTAVETAFLRCGERRLQNAQENYARHPAELRHIKDPRCGIEQQQIQRPVERAESKAAVEAQQQEICLSSTFPVGYARNQRADERGQ